MIRISMDLFNVNKNFKVKFGLTVKKDPYENPNGFFRKDKLRIFNKYEIDGHIFYRITPFPQVIFDITPVSKLEEWDKNNVCNLSRMDLFKFMKALNRLLKNFIREKNLLFYDQDDMFYVNNDIARKITETVIISGGKGIRMVPSVIYDDTNNRYYEGITVMINKLFC